jgi:hypothetical protein
MSITVTIGEISRTQPAAPYLRASLAPARHLRLSTICRWGRQNLLLSRYIRRGDNLWLSKLSRGFALTGLPLLHLASSVARARSHMARMSAVTSRRPAIAWGVHSGCPSGQRGSIGTAVSLLALIAAQVSVRPAGPLDPMGPLACADPRPGGAICGSHAHSASRQASAVWRGRLSPAASSILEA